jgi:hypothetical protein
MRTAARSYMGYAARSLRWHWRSGGGALEIRQFNDESYNEGDLS